MVPSRSDAQLKLDLNERIKHLPTEALLDTVEVPRLGVLKIGSYHTVPNFLQWDFGRERVVEEYSLDGRLRLTFRHPRTERFDFEEQREGAFIVMQPRDLSTPGLSIEVETVDDIAESIRRRNTAKVWRQTSVESVVRRRVGDGQGGRGINIDVPLPLPGVLESIIGEGEKTNIDISGRESISISGESRIVDPYIGVEGQQSQSLFPALDLRQELDVRLQGQIGEKVNIQVDHSSAAVGPLSNRIRLNYKGFEDDIVKLIELGNTSLTLPGSQLVSFSGQAKGLFGVKALAQVGPMDLTVIASKEEGETSSSSFTPRGGTIGQTEERRIRSIDYVKNIYFFLDNPYDLPALPPPYTIADLRPILDSLDVYESVTPQEIQFDPNIPTIRGLAYVDSSAIGENIRQAVADLKAGMPTAPVQSQLFRRLIPNEDYQPVIDINSQRVIGIELNRAVPNNKALAVSYSNRITNDLGVGVGSRWDPTITDAQGDTLYLELIKPLGANPNDDFGYTWHFMMRNIYNLGLSSIDKETLEIEIEDLVDNRLNRTIPVGSTVPWIRVFGLDQTDQFGTGPPDNRVDLSDIIDFTRGTLTFPSLTPFNQSDALTAEFVDTLFSFNNPPYTTIRAPQIYDQDPTRPEDYYFFDILLRAQSTTRSFRIEAFNITPNSEVIKLDGRTLSRDRDYTINYDTGEVELQGDVLEDLTPSSNITIDYEFQPIAGGGGSTLMGFNSIFNLSPNSKIGTTWLYESKGTASNRPRLGEEPTRAIVGDINTTLNFTPGFLTDAVNLLPLVDSNSKSIVSIIGEVAMSMPDPNTQGEVYIDDFEGIEDSDIISMTRRNWFPASPPVDLADTNYTDALPAAAKEKIFWYNIEPDLGVHRRDLNPSLDERESTLVPSLDIEVDAFTSGDSTSIDSTHWVGVMTGFRGGGLDLSQGQFIEVWVNDFKQNPADRGGILRIDIGRIDEDYYRPDDNEYEREDVDYDGFVAGDGPLSDDTGLDGVMGTDGEGVPGDDGDDDYKLERDQSKRFTRINGTEQNFVEDDEDLDRSGILDQTNSYFSYAIDLSSEAVVDVIKEYPGHPGLNDPGHKNDAWRLYRVRLAKNTKVSRAGMPDFQQIKHMRIWFEDIDKVVRSDIGRIQLVDLKIVGNRWERDGIRNAANDDLISPADTTDLTLGVINTKTDPEYDPPIRPNERDEISEKEQSLLVHYENMDVGEGFRIRKRFLGRGLDFTQYRDLNFFVHTDQFFPPPDSVEYYFQIAFDSLNFYEIRMPLTQAYFPNGWSRVLLNLNDLTDLKFAGLDSVVTGSARDMVDPSRVYPLRMVGRPNLFSVRFLYAGLRNKAGQVISGDLWVNDIYLGNRKRDIDFAQRFSTTINMGNVITLAANWARTGPDFRGLRQRRGEGSDRRNLALTAKSNLVHFLPLFGFTVPLSANYNRNLSLPKFVPNSDTEIEDAALRDSLRTESSTRGFSATVTRQGSKSRLLRYTLDKTKINYSLSQARQRSPAVADTSTSMSGTLDYSIQWGGRHDIRLFRNVRFRYWPNSMNFRADANRRSGQRWRNVGGELVADPKFFSARLNETGSFRYVPFRSLTGTYRLTVNRDAARPHEWFGIDIGTEVSRDQAIQLNFKPPDMWGLRAFKPDMNYRVGYNENASPNVARPGDPEGTRNASANRNISVKASYDLGAYAKRLFQSWKLIEPDSKQRRQPGRPQHPRAGAPRDTTQTAPADTTGAEEDGKPVDRLAAVKKLASLIAGLRKINGSYRQTVGSNYTRIVGRPSILYQLGLTNDTGVEGYTAEGYQVFDTPNRHNTSNAFTFDTGLHLTRNIDVTGRFGTTLTKTRFREVNTASISESNTTQTIWPDFNVSWKGLEEWGIFSRMFNSTSATLSWQSRTRDTGRGDEVLSSDQTRTITPAMVFVWKNNMTSNLSINHSRNVTESQGSTNETTSLGVNADLKYSFDAGRKLRIPFFADKVLQSKLDTNLSMGYTRRSGKRSTGSTGFFVPIPKTTTIFVSPRVNYSFTRALNGSFFINYSRIFNEATAQTTTILRIGVDAIFTF